MKKSLIMGTDGNGDGLGEVELGQGLITSWVPVPMTLMLKFGLGSVCIAKYLARQLNLGVPLIETLSANLKF